MRSKMPTMPKKHLVYLLQLLAVFGLYLGGALFGLKLFSPVSGFATLIWPPTAIALVALIIFGYRLWPAIFFGALIANLITGAPPFVALGIAAGNMLEAVVGAYLFKQFDLSPSLTDLRDVLGLIIYCAVGSTIVSASIGTGSLLLGGVITEMATSSTWWAWYAGDLLSNLILAPFLLVWITRIRSGPILTKSALHCLFLIPTLLAINILIFGNQFGTLTNNVSLAYLVFIPLIWAAIKFAEVGATAAILTTSTIAVLGTATGSGPFIGATTVESLYLLEFFLIMMSTTILLVGASVAERKQVEKELRKLREQSESRYRNLVEGAPDIIFTLSPQGKITSLNQVFEKILGWSRDEWIGKEFAPLVLPADQTRVSEHFSQLLTGAFAPPIEACVLAKSGKCVNLESTAMPIFSEGKLVELMGIARDITERKKMEEAVRQSRELERLNKALIGRELRMLELKKEITKLKKVL